MLSQRCQLAAELWQANIPTEFGIEKENPNFKDQLDKADNEGIPLVVVLGEAELAKVLPRVPLVDVSHAKRCHLPSFIEHDNDTARRDYF